MSFLVFEGIDGSGKSTLIKALDKELQKRGIQSIITREPGGTSIGQTIRNILLEKTKSPPHSKTEALLYYADRQQHIAEVIQPALEKKKWIISDRYWASTFAYQCGGRQIPEDFISFLNEKICLPEYQPDLWILLDLPVEEASKRLIAKKNRDRFEVEEKNFHQRIRDYYLKLSQKKPDSWLVLDSTQAPEKMVKTILNHLENKLLFNLKIKM